MTQKVWLNGVALTRRKSISNSWRGEIYLKMVTKYYYLKEEVLKLLLHYGFKSEKVQETRASTRSDWQSATNWSPTPWTITQCQGLLSYYCTVCGSGRAQQCLESFRNLRALSRCTFKCLWMYLHYTNMFGKYMFREESSKSWLEQTEQTLWGTSPTPITAIEVVIRGEKLDGWKLKRSHHTGFHCRRCPPTHSSSLCFPDLRKLFIHRTDWNMQDWNECLFYYVTIFWASNHLFPSTVERSKVFLLIFFTRCQRHSCKWGKCNLCLWSGQLLGCQEKTVTTLT